MRTTIDLDDNFFMRKKIALDSKQKISRVIENALCINDIFNKIARVNISEYWVKHCKPLFV